MLTIANKGGEEVKKPKKHANVICERPPARIESGTAKYVLGC